MDEKATCDRLLLKDTSIWLHHRNLSFSATAIFKEKIDVAPNIMEDVFYFRERLHNLRSKTGPFMTFKVRTAYHGLNFVIYLVPGIWKRVPDVKS